MGAILPVAAPAIRLAENREIDRIAHRVPGIARMKLIPALINGQEARGIRRVANRDIEVDHGVEFAARSDEGVQGLALRLALGGVIKRALEGRSASRR